MRGTPRAYFTSCVVRPSRVFYLKEIWFNKLPFIRVWWNTNFNLHPYTYMYISKNCMRPNTFTYVYIHIQFYETLFAPRCRWKYTCIQDINIHILTHIHIHWHINSCTYQNTYKNKYSICIYLEINTKIHICIFKNTCIYHILTSLHFTFISVYIYIYEKHFLVITRAYNSDYVCEIFGKSNVFAVKVCGSVMKNEFFDHLIWFDYG